MKIIITLFSILVLLGCQNTNTTIPSESEITEESVEQEYYIASTDSLQELNNHFDKLKNDLNSLENFTDTIVTTNIRDSLDKITMEFNTYVLAEDKLYPEYTSEYEEPIKLFQESRDAFSQESDLIRESLETYDRSLFNDATQEITAIKQSLIAIEKSLEDSHQ